MRGVPSWKTRFLPVVLGLSLSCLLPGCSISSEKLEFEHAQQDVQKKNFKSAFTHFKAVMDHDPRSELALKSAKEAARISHYELKDYKEAVRDYKNLVLYSTIERDRIEAQKKIADLQFGQILDYDQAITEYNRLLELPHSTAEDLEYRTAIAKSYFYKNSFFQALAEIDTIIKHNYKKDLLFDPLLLKANIYLTTKQLDDAVTVLKRLMSDYPERAKTETIGLVLGICYEEQKNYAKAIETLESIKNTYPRKTFIENRIKLLKERQAYLPGAKGLKK
jgi:outer membrane protein assembly factor BamD (BamD/ComL family)